MYHKNQNIINIEYVLILCIRKKLEKTIRYVLKMKDISY
jgi:hypothetical protein